MALHQGIGQPTATPHYGSGSRLARRARRTRVGQTAGAASDPTMALVAMFPVVRRLVGSESFAAVVQDYLAASHDYPLRRQAGQFFPQFLRGLAGNMRHRVRSRSSALSGKSSDTSSST
jgi:hypothetical protein